MRMIKDLEDGKYRQEKGPINDIGSSGHDESDILSSLPQNVVDEMSEKALKDVVSVATSVYPLACSTLPHIADIGESLATAEDNCRDTQSQENSYDGSENHLLTESVIHIYFKC